MFENSMRSFRPRDCCGESPFRNPSFWIAALLGTLLSVCVTGYLFAVNNNLFHLVIVADLFDEPQFIDDLFIQSMRYYAAGPWILLRGSASWIDPFWLFLALFIFSRLLSFIGFLACSHILGLYGLARQLLFVILVAVTFLMEGTSLAGGGGLFIEYFGHSEIGNGLFLLVIYAVLRGRVVTALGLVGLTFFVNAFFGVWTAAVALVLVIYAFGRGEIAGRSLLASATIGSLIAILLAAPVIANILQNPEFGKPISFDYVDYLRDYDPIHSLFASNRNRFASKIGLALISFVGLSAFRLGWPNDRRFTAALLTCIATYVIGIFAPLVTHSPIVLNLHLLRSSTLIHELTALACSALATRWWFDTDHLRRYVLAPCLLFVLSVPPIGGEIKYALIGLLSAFFVVAITPKLMAYVRSSFGRWIKERTGLQTIAVLWLAGVVAFDILHSFREARKSNAWIAEWHQIGEWARENTDSRSVFLIPFFNYTEVKRQWTESQIGSTYSIGFEYVSHRRVWVDYKRGAAAMWTPSYYPTWRRRVTEVFALESIDEQLAYAQAHGISYVIDIPTSGCQRQPVFHTARICVYKAG